MRNRHIGPSVRKRLFMQIDFHTVFSFQAVLPILDPLCSPLKVKVRGLLGVHVQPYGSLMYPRCRKTTVVFHHDNRSFHLQKSMLFSILLCGFRFRYGNHFRCRTGIVTADTHRSSGSCKYNSIFPCICQDEWHKISQRSCHHRPNLPFDALVINKTNIRFADASAETNAHTAQTSVPHTVCKHGSYAHLRKDCLRIIT